MDVGVLRGRIIATLDADADSRRRAELDLKTVSIDLRPTLYPAPTLYLIIVGRGPSWIHRCASRYPTGRAGGPGSPVK